ncbi:cupin domain-containing protein [Bacteroidota bacterium]
MNKINHSMVYTLKSAVEYAEGSIVSKIIEKNEFGNITLFAFDKGQNLSEHTTPFNALVQIIEGKASIIINRKENILNEGEIILMPANVVHAIEAPERFKMLLTMIKKQ